VSGIRVALDGPGSSGKSSVGAAAATQLGYRFLDTGVLYRAITLLSVLREIPPTDGAALVEVVPDVGLLTDESGSMRRVTIADEDVTSQIHVPAVDRNVSAVSAQPEVRAALLDLQRELAAEGSIILAGRDIGTVVLPDAELKLYLQVSVEERARRRAAERGLALDSEEVATILADLQRRDHLDSSRETAPLRIPDDAVIVTSDGREFDDTVAAVVAAIRARAEQGTMHA
jgi:cytidylate kinase